MNTVTLIVKILYLVSILRENDIVAIIEATIEFIKITIKIYEYGYKFFKLSFGFIISFKVGFELIGQFYIINTYIFNNSAYLN